MKETIRKTLPRNISMGMLIIIFVIVYLLAGQLFEDHQDVKEGILNIYTAYFLVSFAVMVMILILWEEILFPVHIKAVDGGFLFRNHLRKLKFQILLYLTIPIIVVFLFLNYKVSQFRFFGWATVVIVFPIVGRIMSGLKNYNDFLQITPQLIAFKDNDHEGKYDISQIQRLALVKDNLGAIKELKLNLISGEQEIIKVHQMELDDFFGHIEKYINNTYQSLL